MTNARRFGAEDIRGILVSPMLARGQEVIIGTKIDDQFRAGDHVRHRGGVG